MLEKAFVILVSLLLSDALLPILDTASASTTEGNSAVQGMWFAIYAITTCLLLYRWKTVIHSITKERLLWILVAIALLSSFWSVAPDITLRRSLALVGTTLFGVYLATRYDFQDQLRLLAFAAIIAALLSLIVALAFPAYGVASGVHPGAWRGVFAHKNTLGFVMALGVVIMLSQKVGVGAPRYITRTGIALCVALLLLSKSLTALLTLLTTVGLIPFFRAMRWRYTLVVPILVLAMLVGTGALTLIFSNAEVVVGSLGRDVTLTGRTLLWQEVVEAIKTRPFFGFGHSAFWVDYHWVTRIWLEINWMPHTAHNGFLDLWLQLGLLGVAVFTLSVVSTVFRAVACLRLLKTPEGVWPILLLTFILLYNLAQSSLLKQHHLLWVLYVATVVSLSIHCPNRRITTPLSDGLEDAS